jgi:Collagen triple helix repeat (20 copies)
MKKRILLFSAMILGAVSFAQAPQKMSYQSVVRDNANVLVTSAPVGVRVSILQGSASGTPVYVETHAVSTNANGLATLAIGAGTVVTGTMASINWAAGPYFVKTETDPTGGTSYTVTGTSEIMSSPYALYAANSAAGPTGPQGPAGPAGAAGAPGAPGLPGTNGTNGLNGTNGTNGAVGPTGPAGAAGATGAAGPAGATGATGAAGTNGTNGVDGATGPVGATGATGAAGANGATGATGAQGTQ